MSGKCSKANLFKYFVKLFLCTFHMLMCQTSRMFDVILLHLKLIYFDRCVQLKTNVTKN